MTKFVIETAAHAMRHADPKTAVLAGQAALLLKEFNESAMVGPNLDPADLAEAFDGVIAVVERLPNALCHLSGHLLSVQRRGVLVDPQGRDTDELAERVRQRCHGGGAAADGRPAPGGACAGGRSYGEPTTGRRRSGVKDSTNCWKRGASRGAARPGSPSDASDASTQPASQALCACG
ncbi:hypothetical protein [Kitasatospora sp. HPMI-4]|uniref:hypothetical protein n=1 Tax=Kitasatospora sp. HPMI-4 TaxID=3448443 RepID=UPI003F1ACEE6